MRFLILSGGIGTGLWPLSREEYPKQFLSILGGRSLLELTVERFLCFASPHDIFIVTQKDKKFLVQREVAQYGFPEEQFICEPTTRGTAFAILYGVTYLKEHHVSEEEIICVTPSDHYIQNERELQETFRKAEKIIPPASFVLLGVPPKTPYPGYGYIKVGAELGNGLYEVEHFVEKPSPEEAQHFVSKEGKYLWNTGIFFFRLGDFEKICGPFFASFVGPNVTLEVLNRCFLSLPRLSIDRLLFEKSENLLVFPCDPGWSDIGTFDALYGLWENDSTSLRSIESDGNLIISQGKRFVVLVGVRDTTVVDTEDVLLLVKRGEAYRVRELLHEFEGKEERLIKSGLTSYRPWGYYKVLEEWERFKIKRLVVYPGMCLSLQLHHHRTEHWVVVRGTAQVVVGEKELYLHEGESIFIPKSTKHRLVNPGKVDLEVIEVQNGEYLGEDDIVRLEDVWGRE